LFDITYLFTKGTVNFLVGMGFLPLRNYLADGDARREGRVFYVFGAILLIVYLLWAMAYKSRVI
jgi:hypothetical protein